MKFNDIDDLDLVQLKLEQAYVEEATGYIIILIDSNLNKYIFFVTNFEGTNITFYFSDLKRNTHIKQIHQIFLEFKTSLGYKLEKCIIENKIGDIYYCRLIWNYKGKTILMQCTFADLLIFSELTNSPIYATKLAIKSFDEFNEQNDADIEL